MHHQSANKFQKVAMSTLRKELALYLRRAKNGEQIIITVDGKPFAQIGPLEANKASGMEYLISSGLLNEPTSQGESKNLTYMSFPIDMSLQTLLLEIRR